VLLFSYRGHGESDGDPLGFTYGASESLDIDAAVQYLYNERGIHRIGAIGHSAGAVAIILSAARNSRLGAVVAASPFTSVDEIWETNRPAFFPKPLYQTVFKLVEWRKGFLREQVRAEQSIGRIAPHPLLIIHGSEDRRITREQALRLFRRAQPPKQMWVIQGANHRSVRDPGLDALMGQIIIFLNQALKGPPATQFTGR
jgi:pimeloyl-ACP methyl ester carboxylesterase